MRTTADMHMRVARPKSLLGSLGALRRAPRGYILSFGLTLSLILLALLVRAFLAPGRFPVRVVRLVGHMQNVPRQALVGAIVPFMHQNFYAINLDTVGLVISQVPWVGSAHVERRFPRTLVVYIGRQRLAAQWGLGGWVNATGAHIHLQGYHPPHGLPVFQGPSGQEANMVAHYDRFQGLLHPLGLTIATLTLSARHTWRMGIYKGPLLVLGHNASAHLARFVRVFPQIATSLASMRRVDLRYTNGFAVGWNGASGDQHDKKG